jgi:adenylate kinase family enzyme
MVNYANSKVYKIWSTQNNKIYVGSTTKQYLSQRMDVHRSQYKRWKDGKFNNITSFLIFDECGLENCFIELLEAKECKSKDELHQLEGKYIRELECVNKIIAGRTKKEYHADHKEIISEYQKQYHEVNKEKLSEYRKKTNSCECGGIYVYSNKSQHLKTIKHCKFIESQTIKPEVYEV